MYRTCLFSTLGLGFVLLLGSSLVPAQRPGALRTTVFAVRDPRVVTEPGKILPRATVVIRDGVIEDVGPDVKAPADALVIEGKGLTVYPGFLDALSNWGFDPALRRSAVGEPAAEDLASDALVATKPDNRKGLTPEFRVRSALKADEDKADAWRQLGFTAHLIAPEGGILVGQSALVSLSGAPPRDAVLHAAVAQHLAFQVTGGIDYPRVLMGIIAHTRQTLLDAGYHARLRQAFEARGRVGKRPPADPALEALAPALEGKQPVVFEADTRDEIERALDFAAEFKMKPILFGGRDAWKAVDRLKREKVPVILRLDFSDDGAPRMPRFFRPGFPPRGLRASTEVPQRVKADRQRRQQEEQRNAAVLHREGIPFAFCTQGLSGEKPWEKFQANLQLALKAGLPPQAALQALTAAPARILGLDRQLGGIARGKAAHLVITDGDFHQATTQVRYVFSDGVRFAYDAKPKAPAKKPERKPEGPPKVVVGPEPATETEADRRPPIRTGGNVLLTGATVITVSGDNLPGTDILVKGGKIAAIGKDLKAPEGVKVIDLKGMFVMPGIIDTHCHFAVSGGVNEFSLSVVPEVRIRDVINSEDVQIYRALAGGVTTARLLHGSANVIGGQDAVIKLKYGLPARQLLIVDAPRGVKFALGENVKRTDGRFPNTRLGVQALLVRAFTEAREYRKGWVAYERSKRSSKTAMPPRRDLRLEALVDVLSGDLKVHCHCYRADEILMLLRVADRFGFKVKSLQHVLEGYKVAPEIARHGASCSPFSDWWAYKWEAADAIPFNAALLTEAGASVCLKSDSNELMRHLYQEAAKCIKYGGMTEKQAFATITLHGAKQLGLDKRTGSIEVGKDADLAVFNGHPLNSYSRVEMTLVEGEVYFQRSEKLEAFAPAVAGPARSTPLSKPLPRNEEGTYVLYNATIHPVSGPVIPSGTVRIHKGKITYVGKEPPEEGVTGAIDAKGLHVYPGMLDAGTVLGLTEVDSARETRDFAEGGDFQPDLLASIAINPDSELIPVTRANGVTTVVTRPVGSVIAGQSALIDLDGWVPREMTVVDSLALHVALPGGFTGVERRPSFNFVRVSQAVVRKQREQKMRRLRELFRQAIVYDEAGKESENRPANPRLEALVPYARGKKAVVIQASRKSEIMEALKLADELKLKVILSGAIDAWKVAGELKKRDVPVIVGPIMAMPTETYDPYDAPFACCAKLHQAGVRFCIRSAGTANTRNLPYEAAMAVSYGLPPEEGLKAVTLYPAQIMGVADKVGSLDKGKRANLVLTNGDILQASTQVVGLFINGRPLQPASKHTRLYERYRERLREVKAGRAPLGTK
jgi:imidazolonepropionase-like amidohydrolase